MSAYYSILYTPIRPAVKEQVSIALLLIQEGRVWFRYSIPKLGIIKKLIPDAAHSLLKSYLKNLNIEYNQDVNTNGQINIITETKYLFSEVDLNNLHKYSNNLLIYSKPTKIDLDVDNEIFNKLFEKFIFTFEEPEQIRPIPTIEEKLDKQLFPKIKDRVNINLELTPDNVEKIIVPTRVTFIGRNDVNVLGQSLDFNKASQYLSYDVSKYISVIQALEYSGFHKGKYFVVGEEPSRVTNAAQHNIWQQIKTSGYIDIVPPDESEEIAEYMETHNVHPFLNA